MPKTPEISTTEVQSHRKSYLELLLKTPVHPRLASIRFNAGFDPRPAAYKSPSLAEYVITNCPYNWYFGLDDSDDSENMVACITDPDTGSDHRLGQVEELCNMECENINENHMYSSERQGMSDHDVDMEDMHNSFFGGANWDSANNSGHGYSNNIGGPKTSINSFFDIHNGSTSSSGLSKSENIHVPPVAFEDRKLRAPVETRITQVESPTYSSPSIKISYPISQLYLDKSDRCLHMELYNEAPKTPESLSLVRTPRQRVRGSRPYHDANRQGGHHLMRKLQKMDYHKVNLNDISPDHASHSEQKAVSKRGL